MTNETISNIFLVVLLLLVIRVFRGPGGG